VQNRGSLALACGFLLAAGLGFGQTDLATTSDGGQVFFSSGARLPGSSDQLGWTTVFRYSEGGWTAFAHSDSSGFLSAPFLSGDASIVGWEKSNGTTYYGSTCCPILTASQLSGIANSSVKIFPYQLAISANARFLATPGLAGELQPQVQDLTTGQVWNPTGLVEQPGAGFQVANDGTFVGFRPGPGVAPVFPAFPMVLVRWRPGVDNKDILSAPFISSISLSADGHSAVLLTQLGYPDYGAYQVQRVDLESGAAQILQQGSSPLPASVRTSISADGSRVLFFVLFPRQHFQGCRRERPRL
jgi:hypothetical protein